MSGLQHEETIEKPEEALNSPISPIVETKGSTYSQVFLSVQEKVELMSLIIGRTESQEETTEKLNVKELQDVLLELQDCISQPIEQNVQCKQEEEPTLKQQSTVEELEDYSLAKAILKQRVKNIRPLLEGFDRCFGVLTLGSKNTGDLEHTRVISKGEMAENAFKSESALISANESKNPLAYSRGYLNHIETLEEEVLSKATGIKGQILSNSTISEADRSLIEDHFAIFQDNLKAYINEIVTDMKANTENLECKSHSPRPKTQTKNDTIPDRKDRQASLEDEDLERPRYESEEAEQQFSEKSQDEKFTEDQSQPNVPAPEVDSREQEFTKAIFELNQQFEAVQQQLFESQQHEILLNNSIVAIQAENEQLTRHNAEIEERYKTLELEVKSNFDHEISIYNDRISELQEQLKNTQLCLQEYESRETQFYSMAGAWNAEYKEIGHTLAIASSRERLLEALITTMLSLQDEDIQDLDVDHVVNEQSINESLNQQLDALRASLSEAKQREESLSLINHRMVTELEDEKIHLQLVVEHTERLAEKLEHANFGQSYIDSVHSKLKESELTIASFKERYSISEAKESELTLMVAKQREEIDMLADKLSKLVEEQSESQAQRDEQRSIPANSDELDQMTSLVQSLVCDLGLHIEDQELSPTFDLEGGLQNLKAEFLKTQEKLSIAEENEREHNQIVIQLNLELEKTKAVLDSAFKKVELFDSTIRDLSIQLEKSTSDDSVNSDIMSMKSELDETIESLSHAKKRETVLEQTVLKLQRELEDMQETALNATSENLRAIEPKVDAIENINAEELHRSQPDSMEFEIAEKDYYMTILELNQELSLARQVQFDYERSICLLESAIQERLTSKETVDVPQISELRQQLDDYDTLEKEYLRALYDMNVELEKKDKSLSENETRVILLEAYIQENIDLTNQKEEKISSLTAELTEAEVKEKEYLKCLFELAEEFDHAVLTLAEQQKLIYLFESSVYEKLSEIQELGISQSQEESVLRVSKDELSTMESRVNKLEATLEMLQGILEVKNLEIQNLQTDQSAWKHQLQGQTSEIKQMGIALSAHIQSMLDCGIDIDPDHAHLSSTLVREEQTASTSPNLISIIDSVTQQMETWVTERNKHLAMLETQAGTLLKESNELQKGLNDLRQNATEQEKLEILAQKKEHDLLDAVSSLQGELEIKTQLVVESSNRIHVLEESIEKLKQELQCAQRDLEVQEIEKSKIAESVMKNLENVEKMSTKVIIDRDSEERQDLAQINTTRISIPEKLEAIDISNSRSSVSSFDHDRDSAVALDDESDGNEGRKALPYSMTELTNKLAEVQAQVRIAQASRRDMDDQLQLFKNKLKVTIAQLITCDQSCESFGEFIADINNTLDDPTTQIEDVIACFDKPDVTLEIKEETRRLTFGNCESSIDTLTADPNITPDVGSNIPTTSFRDSTRGRASTFSGHSVQEICKLQSDLGLYALEIETLKSQKASYEKQCRSFQETIMVSQTREGKLGREVQELRSRLEAHKVESMNALTTLQAKYRESVAEIETKGKQQLEESERELFVAKKRIVRLKEQVSSTEKVCADAVSLTEQLETELARTWKEKRTAEKQLLESQQRCEDLGKDLRIKELELASQKQLYDSKLKDMDLKIRDKVKSFTIARRATIVNSPERRGSFYQQLRSKWTGGVIDESNPNNPRVINELEARCSNENCRARAD
ncbi:hypothetical protein K7432_008529 [Basidiobolus ranarum]|uniref:Pericentrin/AKAP-450 centrosomal targeting domain-containing protein n=1 Tax=Basidiobolus ranarum TaxID=34480 RepID=A0ABR2VZD4_9FUNG